MKIYCVIFDLDGTLCELKPESKKNSHTGYEKPILQMLEEIEKELVMIDVDIYIMTGRKEKYRDITIAWLEKNNIQYDYLIMQE